MGQYYYPLIVNSDGTMEKLYSHNYGNGLKLMEHSYIGNNFVNAVLSQLMDEAKRIAWIGDYSDGHAGREEEYYFSDGFVSTQEEFMKYYYATWVYDNEGEKHDEESIAEEIRPDPDEFGMVLDCDHTYWYLVNETKKTFIDLDKYFEQNKYKWYDDLWCVNPLPLLTAVGNGAGGGDFFNKECESYYYIGSWAFDKIRITDEMPGVDYTEDEFYFEE